jgi:hypothetical protein
MKQKSGPDKAPAERVVKNIQRQTVLRNQWLEGVRTAPIGGHYSINIHRL